MVAHTNFYETQKEAKMRLERTVVLYDGKPYFVLAIEDNADGIFRMYLDDLLQKDGPSHRRISVPYDWMDEPGMTRAQKMDQWMTAHPTEGVIRKMMNSPLFNKFRPFPLGMVNVSGRAVYCERNPTRSTYQGLNHQMVACQRVRLVDPRLGSDDTRVSHISREFADMIVGDYPSPQECLRAMTDPRVANEAVAFHRMFAILRGPLGMLFLAYKNEVIGVLTEHDFTTLRLGSDFKHLKEVVTELGLFDKITIKEF